MKNYELTYLIPSELSEEEAKEFQGRIASSIKEEGGILNGENSLLRKKLAYPIKKQFEAFLAVLDFQLEPERMTNLEKKLKSENQILRYLIVTKAKPKEALLRKRRERKVTFEKPAVSKEEKKVELKEIEKKLEEILGDEG